MRLTCLVTLVLIGSACSDQPSNDGVSTTMMEGGDGDSGTETGSSGDLPGDGDGDGDNPCGCEDGQLCVGDCVYSDVSPDWVAGARCIEGSACNQGDFDSLACMAEACGFDQATRLMSCGDESVGYDILCDVGSALEACDEIFQDCAEGQKCVAQIPNPSNPSTSNCVTVEGSDAPFESCTSEGAGPDSYGKDSCDATSMCWNGSLIAEPFAGICVPFCDLANECPDPLTCVEVVVDFHVCVPPPP